MSPQHIITEALGKLAELYLSRLNPLTQVDASHHVYRRLRDMKAVAYKERRT